MQVKKYECNENYLNYQCNICGTQNSSEMSKLSREIPSCRKCGSTVRWRSIIHTLSSELFEQSLVLTDFPLNKNIKGVGMSDWDEYAVPLANKLDYTNTYNHQEPRLDITSIKESMKNTFDFVISSDVFEHVLYPVSRAFKNTSDILKENGVFIFTVPYTIEGDKTVEHFGQLNEFEIFKKDDKYIMRDILKTGEVRLFENLVFHGGPGSTLEMRVFTKQSLMKEFKQAGFNKVKIYSDPYLKYGIFYGDTSWVRPIVATKK